jgi:hypothetical protein
MPEDRVIVVQAAAFASGALPTESTPGATPENQKLFVQRLIESGIPFVYRFAFDAWFAQQASPPGSFSGLWEDQLQPKPVVAVLDLGLYDEGHHHRQPRQLLPANQAEQVFRDVALFSRFGHQDRPPEGVAFGDGGSGHGEL